MPSLFDWAIILLVVWFSVVIGLVYYEQKEENSARQAIGEAQDAVFTQIDHNTTNAEILELINKECKASGYKDRCILKLRDSFVINAKGT